MNVLPGSRLRRPSRIDNVYTCAMMTAGSGQGGASPVARVREKPAAPIAPRADTLLSMRVPTTTRELIDTAAAALGKSRTEFVLDSARQHAVDVLLDQRVFNLDERQSAAFARALAAPVEPNAALRALMKTNLPWQ